MIQLIPKLYAAAILAILATPSLQGSDGMTSRYEDNGYELVNLTKEGSLDWIKWGYKGWKDWQPQQYFVRKDSAVDISDVTGGADLRPGSKSLFSWTDGTPNSTKNAEADGDTYRYVGNMERDGILKFTVQLNSKKRLLLKVYVGGYEARNAQITATLGSRSVTQSLPDGNFEGVYTLEIQAVSADDLLDVQYSIAGGCSFIAAATLSEKK
jgi:hypothetical protein